MNRIRNISLPSLSMLVVFMLVSSCSTVPSPGTLRGSIFRPFNQPLTIRECSISLSDRTGLPMNNQFALQYLEMLLTRAGIYPGAGGYGFLDVACREQSIGNSLQGIVSISAVLTITDLQDQVAARFIYLGYSKEGLESDLFLFRIINRLVKKLMKDIPTGGSG